MPGKTNASENWGLICSRLYDFDIREGITSFVNPYSMLQLQDKQNLAEKVDYWYIDGISLVRLVNLLLNKKVKRFSFDDTSIAPVVFAHVRKHQLSLALIGTEKKWIEKTVAAIENKFGVKVNFYRDGFFDSDDDRAKTLETIKEQQIQVVVCGMGTPRQESFLAELKDKGWKGYGFTCGGYLHQIAGKADYYPRFFDRLNIRWIYRIWDEPKLISRYAFKYPVFFFKFLFFAASEKNIK